VQREARDERARTPVVSRRATRWAERVVWGAATAALLLLGASAIRNKVSWYLAVDQLGYLLSAQDLLHFRIFHSWPAADALSTVLPNPTDVLAQSYLWDAGRLYSRYAPGFPIILAGWMGLFGRPAAHALNPTLFLAALVVLVALVWRAHRSLWRGTAAAALVFLCPTGASIWALTVTRDVSAHLCGFAGLALLAGRGRLSWVRAVGAGLVLGYAASIRPDAVLYLIPAAMLAYGRYKPDRMHASLLRLAGAGSLGVFLGLAPSLLIYWTTTGSPFTPPQAIEMEDFFGPPRMTTAEPTDARPSDARVGYPPGAWRGGTLEPVSGEGMKLTYLLATLPGNLTKIHKGYGDVLIALAAVGLVATAFVRPVFAVAIGSYVLVALLFYSCWGRPYGRYLVGVWLFVPILIVDGAVGSVELVRRLRRRGAGNAALALAGVVAVVLLGLHAASSLGADGTSLLAVTRLVVLVTVLGLGAAVAWPHRRIARLAAPPLALGLVLLAAARFTAPSPRASFQRSEVERATATVRQNLKPRAVVITTEDIGRPAENFEYYGGVNALYLTDLERWRVPIERAAFFFLVSELEPYLLIPRGLPEHDRILDTLRGQFLVELVADIPPARNYDYFVSSAFHAGVPLELWHVR
jgi:hypothetical protein